MDQRYWRDDIKEMTTLIQLRHEAGWAEAFNLIQEVITGLKDVKKGFVYGGKDQGGEDGEDEDGVMQDDEEEDLYGSD
jgi:hypothetical protein